MQGGRFIVACMPSLAILQTKRSFFLNKYGNTLWREQCVVFKALVKINYYPIKNIDFPEIVFVNDCILKNLGKIHISVRFWFEELENYVGPTVIIDEVFDCGINGYLEKKHINRVAQIRYNG